MKIGSQSDSSHTFDVEKFDAILSTRGLSYGVGKPEGQMCIEAAICNVLGMDHGAALLNLENRNAAEYRLDQADEEDKRNA